MLFLADESCDFAAVRALRAAGHDVVAIREASPGVTDDIVAGRALREDRVLLTEDKDFGQLCWATSGASPGVILIRFPSDARAFLGKSIVDAVDNLGGRIRGRFVVLEPGRIRVSKRPSTGTASRQGTQATSPST